MLSPGMLLERWSSIELSELQALLRIKEHERAHEEALREAAALMANR